MTRDAIRIPTKKGDKWMVGYQEVDKDGTDVHSVVTYRDTRELGKRRGGRSHLFDTRAKALAAAQGKVYREREIK